MVAVLVVAVDVLRCVGGKARMSLSNGTGSRSLLNSVRIVTCSWM